MIEDICDNCCHLRSVVQNWVAEARFQKSKFEQSHDRRDKIRDALRAVENDDTNSSELWRELHMAVFN